MGHGAAMRFDMYCQSFTVSQRRPFFIVPTIITITISRRKNSMRAWPDSSFTKCRRLGMYSIVAAGVGS